MKNLLKPILLLILLCNIYFINGQTTNTYTSKIIEAYDYHTKSRVLLTERTLTTSTIITIKDSNVTINNHDLNLNYNLNLNILENDDNQILLYSTNTTGDNIFIGVYEEYITIIFLFENSIIYKVYDFYIDTKNGQKVWN